MDETNEIPPITESPDVEPESPSILVIDASVGDVDERGHLATGLFVGVILMVLVLIYALLSAALGPHV